APRNRFEVNHHRPRFFRLRRAFSNVVFGDVNKHYIEAARRGNVHGMLKWLERGADPYHDDHAAIGTAHANGHKHAVQFLLKIGGDPTLLDEETCRDIENIDSALDRAVVYGRRNLSPGDDMFR